MLLAALRAQAQSAELSSELEALQARREQLRGVLASTPQPAASKKALRRLQQATDQVKLLQRVQVRRGLQGRVIEASLTMN